MRTSYIEYSMSVIVSRALPDVRDGLKPVHRRTLTAMNDLNLQPGRPYRKSAKITGDTTGNYHPHGTTSVYDTLVRMAQDFSLRYPLVDGQGNFGSVDGDAAAAERYTEARLEKFATELLDDLDKETVDFVPNYDGSRMMPSVMPARVPNLLVNGSEGIAVGMATKIPPHNLTEICDGLVALLDNPDCQPHEMLQYVQGPDFPTGGVIHGRRGIFDYVTTGRGRVVVRAKTEMEMLDGGRAQIIVNEIPYQVNKSTLIEKIANLVRAGVLEGISDLRDESDREGMRIVIVLKKDAFPQVVLKALYAHTLMQSTFGVINLALVGNQPKVMSLKEAMQEFLNFREEVVVRRTRYQLRKAEERAHILEGYRIALDNIDAIVALIRASASTEAARTALMATFALSEIQAQAILDLRLARLTGLERQKIEDEYRELLEKIAHLKAILDSRALVLQIIRDEIAEVRASYGDERRTQIVEDEGEIDLEDLIADEPMVVTISNQGYAKRIPVDTYRQQGRGGKGITAMGTKDEDFVDNLFIATTHQYLLVLTENGQLHWLKVHRIPKSSRTSKGQPLVNLIQIQPGDRIHAIVPVREFSETFVPGLRHRPGPGQADASDRIRAPAVGRHPRHQPARGRAPGGRARDRRQQRHHPGHERRHVDPLPRGTGPLDGPHRARRARHRPGRGREADRHGGREREGRDRHAALGDRERLRQAHPAQRLPPAGPRRQGPDHDQVQRAQRHPDGHPRRAPGRRTDGDHARRHHDPHRPGRGQRTGPQHPGRAHHQPERGRPRGLHREDLARRAVARGAVAGRCGGGFGGGAGADCGG
jgi:DNA gyrase subunit A